MDKKYLQLATYICPSIDVEYCELIACFLETQLGIQTKLLYDSKCSAPDTSKGDQKIVDMAFVTTSAYLEKFVGPESCYKLLPVGAVFSHQTKGETLGYFTDLIIARDTKERVKEFNDLRGLSFAYAGESSISGSKQVLLSLKQFGENASFFSDVKAAGNHRKAIEMVLARKAGCAAVCSVSLKQFLNSHYYLTDDIEIQESWGPLPPHPIVINKDVPDNIVKGIGDALLRMHRTPGWAKRLNSFSCVRFEPISVESYYEAKDLLKETQSLSIGVTYY